jgi:hypothetical protein
MKFNYVLQRLQIWKSSLDMCIIEGGETYEDQCELHISASVDEMVWLICEFVVLFLEGGVVGKHFLFHKGGNVCSYICSWN